MKKDAALPFVADRDCDTDPLNAGSLERQIGAQSPDPQTTKQRLNYSIKIDWLEFTVYGVPARDVVQGYLSLPFDDFIVENYSIQGFQILNSYGSIKVLESPTHEKAPVKVILSSQALDQVNRDALDIISVAHRDGVTFVRIDIAVDCFTELLSMDLIGDAIRSGKAVHRFRRMTPRQDLNTKLEVITNSWTFGSSKGKRMLVIYDKRLERIDRGHDDPGHWIRIEGRWKSSTAKIVAKTIVDCGLDAGYILGILDFRELDSSDSHQEKRSRCDWWETFLGNVQPIRTGEKKKPSTIKQKVDWVRGSICTTIAQVFVSEGLEFIKSVIRDGIKRTEEKEWIRLFGPRMDQGYLTALLNFS